MSLDTLHALWNARDELKPSPPLLSALADVRRMHLPGSSIARRLEIYLAKEQAPHTGFLESVASIESSRYRGRNILLISLNAEQEDVHRHVAEHIQHSLDPVDVFLHYPYTKHMLSKAMVSDSYSAKKAYSLDTPKQFQRFGDEVRFHYCDLRLDWIGAEPEQRVQLLGAYSEYLLRQQQEDAERVFADKIHHNRIEFEDFLSLDEALVKLEGKISKSYLKVEPELGELIRSGYERLTQECRARLELLKEEILQHAIVPVYLYIEFLGELNELYQYLNASYVLLRMFRHYAQVPNIHSGDAVKCVVVLPKQVVSLLQRMMPSLKGMPDSIDNFFR